MNTPGVSDLPSADHVRARVAEEGIPKPQYPRVHLGALSSNVVLFILGLAFVIPLVWIVLSSIDSNAGAGLEIPHLSVANYRAVMTVDRMRPFLNSFYLAFVSTVVSTVVGLLAGYGLSRHYIPLKRTIMLFVLFMSGLPVAMLLVPAYQMYVQLQWLDSLFWTSIFLAATSLPFTVWLLKNFIDQVPRELEEAAAIEGTGPLGILVRVVIPLAMPGILVTALITFINAWGAFAIPLVLDSNPEHMPGAVAIYQFMSADGQTRFGDLSAYSILFAIPVIVLYLIASRRISGAFTFAGGIKS